VASNRVLFLHLSDIHIRTAEDAILQRGAGIAATTFQYLPEIDLLVLVLSGDIAWSGRDSEYVLAESLINEIATTIGKERPGLKIEIFACPGNHDCDFSLHDDTRDAVLERVRTSDSQEVSPSLVETATAVQEAYFKFLGRVSTHPWASYTKLMQEATLVVDEVNIGMRCLNVAWMSELREKQGTLMFPPSAVKPFTFDKQSGLAITILHHPFNWFGQTTYRHFQAVVRNESHIVFTGHEHFQNSGEISDSHSSPSVFVEGGVLFESSRPNHSSFNLVIVDLKAEQYRSVFIEWTGKTYAPDAASDEVGSLRTLPSIAAPHFKLRPEFEATLVDAGANFSHANKKKLVLDDIFVWPDLLDLEDRALIKRQLVGSFFEDPANVGHGILIRGDEKTGKSTLLRQYFRSFFKRGFLPLYVRAQWITSVHQTDPLKLVKTTLDRQYERDDHESWLQESRSLKVLLLDDVDLSSLSPAALSIALDGLAKFFFAVIVTARDTTAATDLLSIEKVDALLSLQQFELREFGHKKRFELVCKWVEVGNGIDESSERWMVTIDKLEKDLTAAVGKQLVPSVPIFLLTLLQSVESGRTADLKNSAFGHYYQYLITSSFEDVGFEREQWNEVFNYCANFAWFIYSRNDPAVAVPEMKAFNQAFSVEFTPVEFEQRFRRLLSANVLELDGDQVHFKYPYIYYFFLGQYLSDRIHEKDVQQVIVSLCEDLHLRDSASVLLFTSHHTKDPVVYEQIAEALDKCFSDSPVFDFQKDVELLNQLVDSAPRLVYHEKTIKESRSEMRDKQDKKDYAVGPEERGSTTDAIAGIARLFRGMEILGQLLKNHYGTTKNPVKEQLINRLIESSLRGLQAIIRLILSDRDSLAHHIGRMLKDQSPGISKEQADQQAKIVVFDLVGIVTFGFVRKASTAIGSAYLRENLVQVVSRANSLGYDLVEISYLLELPEGLPFSKLKQMNKNVEANPFCRALLTQLALHHLHMFKVNYRDKQKLCEELGIGLQRPNALQFNRATLSRRRVS
jgi:hypothetical protein